MGTIFSLRSRRKQDTYLSLEVSGFDFKLVHATSNGTDVVRIPTALADRKWHQVAIGIRDDSVVESYTDCEWSRTDILKKDAIEIPEDSDLIIGYLFSVSYRETESLKDSLSKGFQGDLEQMSIVSDPSMVSLQCSPMRTPIIDPSVKDNSQDGMIRKPLQGHKKYQNVHHKRKLA